MLNFAVPQLKDSAWIRDIVCETKNRGSDLAFGNIYLLRNKYDTLICHYEDFLIRKYNGVNGRAGYTFPVGRGDVKKALWEIANNAKEQGEPFQFCLLTEEQKVMLNDIFPERFAFSCNEGDTDYIYLSEDLANLRGKPYHKKKNHVSKFYRTYEKTELCPITEDNKEDAWHVEEAWCQTHMAQGDSVQIEERNSIREALDYFDELLLTGAVLYVEDQPAAMTIASKVNADTCDIHFEKVVDEYAVNGGYSVINQAFVEELTDFMWINREEDLGIEGLRKAKMSYHPKMLLNKYSAKPL